MVNTVTGMHIADVATVERCEPSLSDSFFSERVLVYRDEDGQCLTRFRGRQVRPLRYAHNVSLVIADGGLLLQAQGPGGAAVASGWGGGRGQHRIGMRRAFELSVRPMARDAAPANPPKPAVAGAARAAVRGAGGTTREEYRLIEPLLPGRPCSLQYRRTGRCPSWYGAGVCTLEIRAQAEPAQSAWWTPWHRRRQARVDKDWDGTVTAIVGE
uniref:Uncharacterized protein n=1 Tax=Haptolina brevifila TaxID=156173 RepID=A0A7S2IDU2_9EUKA